MASFFALAFASCEPMEDVYDEIDANKGFEYVQNIEYTLSAEDYSSISKMALVSATNADDTVKAKAIESLLSFSDERLAANYLPGFLDNKYQTFDPTSSAIITYSYDTKDLDYLTSYTDSDYFKLGTEEYASVDATTGEAGFFTPAFPAEDNLNEILKGEYTDAADGDIVLVSYDQRETNYDPSEVDVVTVFSADFSENLDQFSLVSTTGDDQVWGQSGYNGSNYAKISGYSSGSRYVNEDWMITPEIDLSDVPEPILNINQALNYLSGDWQQTFVYISDKYDSEKSIDVADWTELTIENKPAGNNWSFVESGDIDLSAYEGKKVHIAFVYKSNTDDASTWEVSQVDVKGFGRPEGNTSKIYYAFDGSDWAVPTGIYNLQRDDYSAMGSGPGKYGNFSSSVPAEDYLPQFLSSKYTYAQEGDLMVVVYKYYSGGTKTYAAEYTFSEGVWSTFPEMIDQYIFTTGGWVFDPTVTFTMMTSDYQSLIDYSVSEHGKTSKYSDSEYYYGASAKYLNFDLRLKNRNTVDYPMPAFEGLTPEEATALTFTRLKDGVAKMLELKYPESQTQVSGIDVFYNVTFTTYEEDLSSKNYTLKFQCTKSGPSPEFTYVDGLPE